ncbi:hypothetical protein [Anaerotruncus rubiinfantis]|uniref:hypothetical protein n=1 Tax=Anaerotruncus rubiinfantis TaxID=1720200 RepID=UPI003D7B2166
MVDIGVIVKDGDVDLEKVMAALRELAETDVLVGIPEDKSAREKTGPGKEDITNAQLAYIHTNGVRRLSMRKEMQPDIDTGKPYPMVLKAYVQEHGSPLWHSPPRPFLEPSIEKHIDEIKEDLETATTAALEGEDVQSHLEKIGMDAESNAKNYFEEDNGWPPNAAATIEKKGSAAPLVDKGAMKQSISYVIRKKGERGA